YMTRRSSSAAWSAGMVHSCRPESRSIPATVPPGSTAPAPNGSNTKQSSPEPESARPTDEEESGDVACGHTGAPEHARRGGDRLRDERPGDAFELVAGEQRVALDERHEYLRRRLARQG